MEDDSFQDLHLVDGITGELDAMCAIEEVRLRSETRQVDKFEYGREFLKKYQRSSADKKYLPSEIRTINACWKSVEYLLDQIIDFDVNPKPGFSEPCYTANFFDIYSFMRDRLRAIRVDLHVQNAASLDPVFIRVHEFCLRFELLSLYLLWGREFGGSSDRKFDLHMTLTALSQTIDPLTNAYSKRREDDQDVVDTEAEITRYILLLSLTSRGGSKQFKAHYLKQSRKIQSHKLVREAFEICCEYYAGRNHAILARIEKLDFLSTCALLPVLNIVRTRALWRMVRTNRPFFFRPSFGTTSSAATGSNSVMPPPRPEKILIDQKILTNFGLNSVSECADFFGFNGLDTITIKGMCLLPPRQLSKNPIKWWLSSREWRDRSGDTRDFQDFEWNNELVEKFETRIGTDIGDSAPPDRSDYPQKLQGVLVKKYLNVSKEKSRKAIITNLSGAHPPPSSSNIGGPQKILQSYPTFAPRESFPKISDQVAATTNRAAHPFGAIPVMPATKPVPDTRPVIPIQPLSAMIPKNQSSSSPRKIFEDHQKRPRDVVSPSPPSPSEPVVIRPKTILQTDPQQPPTSAGEPSFAVIVPVAPPIPPLPPIQSGFDILATELESLNISFPALATTAAVVASKPTQPIPVVSSMHAKLIESELSEAAEQMRELEVATRRTKFIALKSLIAWRQIVRESQKWKRLLAADSPIRL